MTVERAIVPLLEPRDGMPTVVTTGAALEAATEALAAGEGPIAIDAERASGYRYGHRAYLLQLRRAGSGTVIIDPDALRDLSLLAPVLAEPEWVLHAANQDLPCLADLGLRPKQLFDTELAGRLLGHPRVGLGAITESVLGYQLEKGHAAVDWSTRPIPDDWLRYAALDVEILVELRDALAAELDEADKTEWARQEFEAIAAAPEATPRQDPWRRTSGIHRLRKPRQLASVRELWFARDELAQQRDIAPGRILPDSAIISAAVEQPADREALLALPVFGGRATKRTASRWLSALERARALPDDQLPATVLMSDAPPPARSWPDRDPEAAGRLGVLRPAIAALADEHSLPTENLLTPDSLRRVAWAPPEDTSTESIAERLRELGARPWQVELTARPIAKALERVRLEQSTT
ncbi:MAG TPA: HRDC domain-containing protein [Actinomycetes bacterium]|nr:HRDC domain-containing protein [Actinomycetes bacterium]